MKRDRDEGGEWEVKRHEEVLKAPKRVGGNHCAVFSNVEGCIEYSEDSCAQEFTVSSTCSVWGFVSAVASSLLGRRDAAKCWRMGASLLSENCHPNVCMSDVVTHSAEISLELRAPIRVSISLRFSPWVPGPEHWPDVISSCPGGDLQHQFQFEDDSN